MGNIINALGKQTNGTYELPGSSTLMSWIHEYDDDGREVTCDPNYKSFTFTYEGKTYNVTKHKWSVYIWNDNSMYTRIWHDDWKEHIEEYADFTPDYVIAYNNLQKSKNYIINHLKELDIHVQYAYDKKTKYHIIVYTGQWDEDEINLFWKNFVCSFPDQNLLITKPNTINNLDNIIYKNI